MHNYNTEKLLTINRGNISFFVRNSLIFLNKINGCITEQKTYAHFFTRIDRRKTFKSYNFFLSNDLFIHLLKIKMCQGDVGLKF